MKKIWVRKTESYREAGSFDLEYYLNMTPQKRIETMQYLREIYYRIKGKDEKSREGLQRVIKVIK
jgi:hypothetical protein